jgi:hypothetical protein
MKATFTKMLCAIACGFALAATAHAADMSSNKKGPTSSNESAPAEDTLKKKGKSGKAVMPSKGPSSVNESAPAKTGKDQRGALVNDNKDMPNPKTPSASNESAPAKSR